MMRLKKISLAFFSVVASSVLVANEVFFNDHVNQNQDNLNSYYNDQHGQQNSFNNSNYTLNPAITGNDLNP